MHETKRPQVGYKYGTKNVCGIKSNKKFLKFDHFIDIQSEDEVQALMKQIKMRL